jgi:LmbE family N-acetylglucosaminyl deacetylase
MITPLGELQTARFGLPTRGSNGSGAGVQRRLQLDGRTTVTQAIEPHIWRPSRFMVIVGHPDDADFGPAGTAAAWIAAGSEGRLVCCTSGDAGGEDPDLDPLELASAREEEQRGAAAVVGYSGVSFMHQPDGSLVNDLPLREMLVREIRTFRPDAVICGDPEVVIHQGGGVNHTDHRAAAMAAVDAVYPAARNPMAFPWLARTGLAAHRVRRLYLMWSNHPDVWIDVAATAERKIEALRRHASQLHDPEAVFARVRGRLAEQGACIGSGAAEAYRLVVIDQDPVESADVAEGVAAEGSGAPKGGGSR